jgi:Xaa-Pro aminopeptidase
MSENGIDIREYETVQSDASLLSSGKLQSSAHGEKDVNEVESLKIWIDSGSCCLALYSKLSPDQVLTLQSPIALPKAVKVNLLS